MYTLCFVGVVSNLKQVVLPLGICVCLSGAVDARKTVFPQCSNVLVVTAGFYHSMQVDPKDTFGNPALIHQEFLTAEIRKVGQITFDYSIMALVYYIEACTVPLPWTLVVKCTLLLSAYSLFSAYTLPAFNPSILSAYSYRIVLINYLHIHVLRLELTLLRWLQER